MPLEYSMKITLLAKEKNFYRVFVGEDILSREIFTYLSIIAVESGMPVASGILSPYVRNIVSIVSATAGLQLITGNKFSLGIGTGGIAEVEKLTGKPPQKSTEVLREFTGLIRDIFRGKEVTGEKICLEGYNLKVKNIKVPEIYFGVRGSKLLALAGEVADGVIFSAPRGYLGDALKIVKNSAKKHGRRDIKKILWNPVVAGKSKNVRVVVATMLVSTPRYILEKVGLAEEAQKVKTALKKGDYNKASALVSKEALREFCIQGSIEDIKEEFETLAREGFQEFIITPMGDRFDLSRW